MCGCRVPATRILRSRHADFAYLPRGFCVLLIHRRGLQMPCFLYEASALLSKCRYRPSYIPCKKRNNCSCIKFHNLWHFYAKKTEYYEEILHFLKKRKIRDYIIKMEYILTQCLIFGMMFLP